MALGVDPADLRILAVRRRWRGARLDGRSRLAGTLAGGAAAVFCGWPGAGACPGGVVLTM